MTYVTPNRDALARALLGNGSGMGAVWTLDEAESVADLLIHHGAVVDASVLADEARDMGEVWGGTAAWLTTGNHVADLMADWITDSFAERGDRDE